MSCVLVLLVCSLAIENLADILTTAPPLAFARRLWACWVPELSKLAECKYCQTFWLSAAVAACLPPWFGLDPWLSGGMSALAMHRMCQFYDGAYFKYFAVLIPEEPPVQADQPVDMTADYEEEARLMHEDEAMGGRDPDGPSRG